MRRERDLLEPMVQTTDPVADLPETPNAALRAMGEAPDYAAWLAGARRHDQLTGADAWRDVRESASYDHALIQSRTRLLRRLMAQDDVARLAFYLTEELHGNLGNMANPALYGRAMAGTKTLITDYMDEVTAALDYLAGLPARRFSAGGKLRFFKRTARGFGRSALMLSGGATLGLFHVGVIKALWEEGLLPRVVCGSSAGSIITAIVGTHTDDELSRIFEPGYIRMEAWRRFGLGSLFRGRGIGSIDHLRRAIQRNVEKLTFVDAFERTGRIINITVSPTDPNQFPRVLNYQTAPHVYVRSAALASCAIPGIFPPVTLRARNFDGDDVDYSAKSQWMDGSISNDIPKARVGRMHNVNHFIVSQTNPHVVPFMSDKKRKGLLPFSWELVSSTARVNVEHLLELGQRHTESPALRLVLDKLHSVATQSYSGDITVFPAHQPGNILRTLADPGPEHVADFIVDGERATWPTVERIRNATRISRTLERCLDRLKQTEKRR